jgi:hypothetical protein
VEITEPSLLNGARQAAKLDLLGGVEQLLATSSMMLHDNGQVASAVRVSRWAGWIQLWRNDPDAGARMRALMRGMREAPPGAPRLRRALDDAIVLLGADFGNIQLVDPADGSLRIAAQSGFDSDFLEYFAVVADDTSACGRARRGQPVVIPDVHRDPAFAPHRKIAAAAGFRAVQSTPIVDRGGPLLGVISLHYRHPHHPVTKDLQIMEWHAHQLGRALNS